MNRIASILAVVFHPIFVPLYLFLVLSEIDPVMSLVFGSSLKWNLMARLVVTMVLGPAFSIYMMKRRGMIDSLEMPTLKGRSAIYSITALYYGLTFYFLKDIELPRIIDGLFLGLIITLLMLAVISLRYKISAHMAGMGGALGAVIWVFWMFGLWDFQWLIGLVFLSAIVASSRLYLQVHDMREVVSGFSVGLLVVFLALKFYIN